jgi:hypothetical protein
MIGDEISIRHTPVKEREFIPFVQAGRAMPSRFIL